MSALDDLPCFLATQYFWVNYKWLVTNGTMYTPISCSQLLTIARLKIIYQVYSQSVAFNALASQVMQF